MEFSATAPAVLLSPHMDDAVLSAWSVLRRPDQLQVVNVFAGVPNPGFVTRYDRIAAADESAQLVRQRLGEDRRALAMAGRRPIRLHFLDEQYRDHQPNRESVAEAVERALASASTLFLPAGLGGHGDHVATREVGREIANSSIPVFLYAELPYAVRYGWPHWVTGTEPIPNLNPDADWQFYLESAVGPQESLRPQVILLSDLESQQKLAAMRTYETQFPSVNSGTVNRLGNPAIHRYEVLWAVVPADG